MNKFIGFQGSNGSFGHIASVEFAKSFLDYQTRSFLSFAEVLDNLLKHNIEYAVLPVKNKIVGEIKDSNEAIDKVNDSISMVKTIQLPIVFCLGVKNAIKIEHLTNVYSQNNALNQCKKFFERYPNLKATEEIDTAIAAEKVSKSDEKIGAICSELACILNDLNVLAKNFQDDEANYTIFNIFKIK